MTLQQLHYILTIAKTGSLSKSAEELYISQPSLTGAVRELETELGVTLFYRSGKGMTLTNDGIEFITYAREIYYRYEQLIERYGKNSAVNSAFHHSTTRLR